MIRRLVAVLLILLGGTWIGRDVWPDGQAALSTLIGGGIPVIAGFWLLDHERLTRFLAWLGTQAKVLVGILRDVKGGAT